MYPETSLIGIPTELRIHIAEYLAGKSLKAFAATCKSLRKIADQTTKEKARLAADTVVLWDGIRQDRPRHFTQRELRDKFDIEVVDQTSLKRYNCLISACRAGDLDAVRGVLETVSPNPPELNRPYGRFSAITWYTPVDYAVISDSTEALELFLAAGFDFTRLNLYDALRLLFGRKPWNRAMADRLIENGLDIHQTGDGDNLLHILCWGRFDIRKQCDLSPLSLVMYLVEKGVEVECRNSWGASSPLSLAIERLKHSPCPELLDLIRFLLEAGSGVNAPCRDHGYTALHVACEAKSKDVVQLLLDEFHADIDVRDVVGATPLYIALEEDSEEICKVLLQKGASLTTTFARQGQMINYLERALDMNLQVRTFYNAWVQHFGYDRPDLLLVAAAALGDVSELERLLPLYEAGQDTEYNVNVALTKAVEYNREGAIDFLLPHTSSVTVVNRKIAKKSTLEIANRRSDQILLKIMARVPSSEAGAYVENVQRGGYLSPNVLMALILSGHAPTSIIVSNSQALLKHAVLTHNLAAFKFLLHHVQQRGFDPSSIIKSAVHYNFLEGVELLLQDSNVDSSILSDAVSRGKGEALKLMINAGADITADVDFSDRIEFPQGRQMQPFAVAVSIRGLSKIMQMLLAANVDPDTKDTLHKLPLLSWAAFHNHADVVRCLIAHGADVNGVDTFGRTALFYAAARTNPATIGILLEAGAQPNLIDTYQMTPLTFAMGSYNHRQTYFDDLICDFLKLHGPQTFAVYVESAQLLLRAGANAHYIDSAGRSVLSHAAETGSLELVQIFIDLGVHVDLVDCMGRTALSWACICGKDTAAPLVAAGCDVSKADGFWTTPLQYIHCDTVDETDAMVKYLYSRR